MNEQNGSLSPHGDVVTISSLFIDSEYGPDYNNLTIDIPTELSVHDAADVLHRFDLAWSDVRGELSSLLTVDVAPQ